MDGSYLGTVCLLDTRPKASMSSLECEPLMQAAERVMQEYAKVCHVSPTATIDLPAEQVAAGWE